MRMLLCAALAAVSAARKLPKAVVINLPKHEARFEGAKRELTAAGVSFERMDAVEGRRLGLAEKRANVTALARALITPGMTGCFLSHRRCWERCVALDEDLLVFEDDIMLEADFARRACAAMDDLPSDWDVMLIGALGLVHPERKYGLWWLVHFLPQLLFLPATGMRWRPEPCLALPLTLALTLTFTVPQTPIPKQACVGGRASRTRCTCRSGQRAHTPTSSRPQAP